MSRVLADELLLTGLEMGRSEEGFDNVACFGTRS